MTQEELNHRLENVEGALALVLEKFPVMDRNNEIFKKVNEGAIKAQISHGEILQKFINDYITRIAGLENRPREIVAKEINEAIDSGKRLEKLKVV